jgi:hypothetical protein
MPLIILGALQQALECVSQGKADHLVANEMFHRFNMVELLPRETLGVAFEYHPNDLRSAISNFGCIVEADDCSNKVFLSYFNNLACIIRYVLLADQYAPIWRR